jgi:hypothetical protein
MSTVLYEALNIVPTIFMLRSSRSKFNIPNHPFQEINNLDQLIKKIKDNKNKKKKLDTLFEDNWKTNFQKYLKKTINLNKLI